MSQIVNKIAAIEEQLVAVLAKTAPLASRLSNLNQAVQTLTDQIEEVGRETLAVQTEFDEMQIGLTAMRDVLNDAKQEGVELTEQQTETKQVCESLTTMFGEAFQVVSRFMETAQRIGITKEEIRPTEITKAAVESESVIAPIVVPDPMGINSKEESAISKDIELGTVTEMESALESLSVENTAESIEPTEESKFEELKTEDMAAQLEIPPLPLNEPIPIPATSEVAELTEEEEQKLENLLMDLSAPITV